MKKILIINLVLFFLNGLQAAAAPVPHDRVMSPLSIREVTPPPHNILIEDIPSLDRIRAISHPANLQSFLELLSDPRLITELNGHIQASALILNTPGYSEDDRYSSFHNLGQRFIECCNQLNALVSFKRTWDEADRLRIPQLMVCYNGCLLHFNHPAFQNLLVHYGLASNLNQVQEYARKVQLFRGRLQDIYDSRLINVLCAGGCQTTVTYRVRHDRIQEFLDSRPRCHNCRLLPIERECVHCHRKINHFVPRAIIERLLADKTPYECETPSCKSLQLGSLADSY